MPGPSRVSGDTRIGASDLYERTVPVKKFVAFLLAVCLACTLSIGSTGCSKDKDKASDTKTTDKADKADKKDKG